MHQKGLELLLYQLKSFSFWGTKSPRPPTIFNVSAKFNNFQKSNIQYRFVHECGQLKMFSNHACCCLFQMFASNMHQNEWFQVRFFKNFLGRGSPSPLPRPLPPFFLGLRPRFGLRPQFLGASRLRIGLRPRFSGASRPRFGLRPQLSVENLVWPPPPNEFLDPPLSITLHYITLQG